MMTDLSHLTESVSRAAGEASIALTRPHVLMRPALYLDGNMYCALYGENIMEGCAGFGETADLAMQDFDKNWYGQKAPTAALKAE